jgi:hypothetical protein
MHLTGRQIEDYHSRALPPRELLEMDDHLAACPDCRLRVAEGETLSGAFAAWETVPEEPTAVRLDLGEILDEIDARKSRTRPWRMALLAAALILLACGIFWIAWIARGPEPAGTLAQSTQQSAQAPGPVLRGPASAPGFTLQAPLSTEVPGGRPTFRWTPLSGAESYRVTYRVIYRVMVFDRDFNRVLDSGPLSGTDWTPDRPLPALPAGTYTWQVKARRGGEEVTAPGPGLPQALFRVVGSG